MTEIYLIRHAQAEGNNYRIMQGHWDGDVTALGRQQIDLLTKRFQDVKVDALYSSDLYRARLTAGAIRRSHKIPIQATDQLREINVGRWETKFFGNVFHDEPDLASLFLSASDLWSVEGSETYAQVGDRAYGALLEILRRHPDQTVAIASHGVTIRCLLSRITGIPLQDRERLPLFRNTAVAHLFFDGQRFTVDYLNDTSHLAPLKDIPWARNRDLRHEILDPAREGDYYSACYADAWKCAHGSLQGFTPEPYLYAALRHHQQAPGSVMRILIDDESVGLVDLDPERGARIGSGWVSLLYLKPEYRAQGYGPQVLGRPVGFFRDLGRKKLRLHVAEDNSSALAFYEKEGFQCLSYESGSLGRLLLMEKSLEVKRDV